MTKADQTISVLIVAVGCFCIGYGLGWTVRDCVLVFGIFCVICGILATLVEIANNTKLR